MTPVFDLLSLANQSLAVAPFIAGVVIALAARKANPRVRWLVLTACLIPLLNVVGTRVFLASDFLNGRGDAALNLAYDLLDLSDQLLSLISMVLFLLAMVIMFRTRTRTGSPC